ncbi:MAG: calcineurin-like phosphoesterase C-terminal domain-containing protein, partial [Muribaculaceae bacterium]|nr:calcineurin-like phosphoesterase C-terminal domain-containing protein [Muribaculaceae bacterium]
SKNYQTLGEDGSAAGVWVADFTDGQECDVRYHTYLPGDAMFRVYDLNEVGRYYKTNDDVQYQLSLYPNRVDYSKPEYADMIMVNFWCDREDLTLEMIENGHSLSVTKDVKLEDPLFNISHYVPQTKRSGKYQKSHDNVKNHHMYIGHASNSTNPVEVIVRDKTGKVIYRETVVRPKEFDKNAK